MEVTGEDEHLLTSEPDSVLVLYGGLTGDGDLTVDENANVAFYFGMSELTGDLILGAGSTTTFIYAGTGDGKITGSGQILAASQTLLSGDDNDYSGGTRLYAGELILEGSHAAGTGGIYFVDSYNLGMLSIEDTGARSAASLVLDESSFDGSAFANVIYGMGFEDEITLVDVPYVAGATAVYADHILTVTCGEVIVTFQIADSETRNFRVVNNHNDGISIVLRPNSSSSGTIPTSDEPTTGNDSLDGSGSEDTIAGLSGNDTTHGGGGADIIYGNGGDDTLFGDDDSDTLYGGQGDDSLSGDDADDQLTGGQGHDHASGGDGNDLIYGNQAGDTLSGGSGDDTVFGGQGADAIDGGSGDDLLVGGLGADIFAFASGDGIDTIVDFDTDAGDKLEIAGQTYALSEDDLGVVISLSGGGEIHLLGVSLPVAGEELARFAA